MLKRLLASKPAVAVDRRACCRLYQARLRHEPHQARARRYRRQAVLPASANPGDVARAVPAAAEAQADTPGRCAGHGVAARRRGFDRRGARAVRHEPDQGRGRWQAEAQSRRRNGAARILARASARRDRGHDRRRAAGAGAARRRRHRHARLAVGAAGRAVRHRHQPLHRHARPGAPSPSTSPSPTSPSSSAIRSACRKPTTPRSSRTGAHRHREGSRRSHRARLCSGRSTRSLDQARHAPSLGCRSRPIGC